MILRNNFHQTKVQINLHGSRTLSKYQVKRARKALCGRPTCTCGGILGERGPQYLDAERVYVTGTPEGGVYIV